MSSNLSEGGARNAQAVFVPDLGSGAVDLFDTQSALCHWMKRLSPASFPKTAEEVAEVSSELIAIISPRVILLARFALQPSG